MPSKLTNIVGEKKLNNNGSEMTIIEYKNAKNIVVKFNNGYITTAYYEAFCNGQIKNPYDKTILGIGYIGVGIYKTQINKRRVRQYTIWYDMMSRCYSKDSIIKHPTYKDCTVCEEWHNYQNFAKWYDENYYEVNNEKMHLDKDILIKGNKIYSPKTCIFVPFNINQLFIKCDNSRGKFPIGVSYEKDIKKFVARYSMGEKNNTSPRLCKFDTPEEAFNTYKIYKENFIKETANKYKNYIPKELYDAMYKYEVEYDD